MNFSRLTRKLQIIGSPIILAALLAAGGLGIGLYQAAGQIRLQKALMQIQNTFDKLRTVFTDLPIDALSDYDLYALNVLNNKNFDTTKTFHPFSHHADSSAIVFTFAAPDYYAVTYKKLPRKACFLIAAHTFGAAFAKHLYAVSLTHGDKTEHFMRGQKNSQNAAPFVSLSKAESFCKNGTDVTWTFYKPLPDDLSAYFEEISEIQTDAPAEPASSVATPFESETTVSPEHVSNISINTP